MKPGDLSSEAVAAPPLFFDRIAAMSEIDQEAYKAGFVALAGRPNVGKSTLVNALLGQKVAAVSPKPQTTRRNQLGILTTDTAQIVFTDTPGLHRERNKLGELMNLDAIAALEDADVLLFVVDASTAPNEEDRALAERIAAREGETPVLIALNKVDLVNAPDQKSRLAEYQQLVEGAEALLLSALTGQGLDELKNRLVTHLPSGPALYPEDQVTDLYERQIAADLIREAALHHLRDEVPHGIAVRVDEFVEREASGALIEATLLVEKESHKGIVIGQGGEMIKAIGIHARMEIEKMSGRKVFLRLRVKVRKDWRDDESALSRFGYGKRRSP
jgi:GTP-binding protein Era